MYCRCCYFVKHLSYCNFMIMTRSIFFRLTFNHHFSGMFFLWAVCHCGKNTHSIRLKLINEVTTHRTVYVVCV